MAAENDDRSNLSFKMGELEDLGIKSTKRIIDAGEAFLSGNVEDIETLEDEDPEDEPVIKVKDPKKATPQQKTAKVIEAPKRELSEDDAYELLNQTETTEENTEEEPEEAIVVKDKKLPAKVEAKTPATTPPTKQEGQTETQEDDDPNAIFNSVAREMVNQGIFQVDEEDEEGNPIIPEITSGAELLEMFQNNARREAGAAIESFLNSKGEEARAIFNSVIVDGVNPREYLSRYAQVQDFKNLDLTIEDNQEKVVREFYRQAGYSPETIDKNIKRLKDNSDLATEAEEAKKVVVKKEEESIKQLVQQKKKEDEDKQRVKTEFQNNIAKILNEKAKAKDFDGIPVDNKIAQEVYNELTEERYTLGDQLLTEFDKEILELSRPNNHPLKVKLYLLLKMMKADPTLSSLSKKVVSKASNEAFQGLRKRNSKAGATGAGTSNKTQAATVKEDNDKITSWFPSK